MESPMLPWKDLQDNPTPRLPVALVLDASRSMLEVVEGEVRETGQTFEADGQVWQIVEGGKSRLDFLNEGLTLFLETLHQDEIARYSVELCVVGFGGKAELLLDFGPLQEVDSLQVPPSEVDGTDLGGAVELALKRLERRREEYRWHGVDYYKPWLVVMTDGKPTVAGYEQVARRVAGLVRNRRLTVFPIGVGRDFDAEKLAMLSPERVPLQLKGVCFREFFQWLSRSASTVSRSQPGESVRLDVNAVSTWAEVTP